MKIKTEHTGIVLFMLPALVIFGLFFLYPVISVGITSFTKWNGMSPPVPAGIHNYRLLFTDPVFARSVKNNLIWILAAGLIQIPLAAAAALILSTKPRGWKTLRLIYFLPHVVSGAAIGMLWLSIYNSEYGLLNRILRLSGAGNWEHNWLGNPQTAFPSILIYWLLYIGYYMVIILADIMTLPKSIFEAASIDGASFIQTTRYITLPLIIPSSFCTCLTLAVAYGLRQFEQVFILTGGGPANRTSVLVLYLYQQMKNNAYGLSAAAGVSLIAMGMVIIIITRKMLMEKE
jgi:raffinose/stachyose/melibiose transport system permease protein